jgi:hypothetical protein
MMTRETTYVIASIELDIGRQISRHSWYRNDQLDAKQILKSKLANLAMRFASNHSMNAIDEFINNFQFELPPEPPTNYHKEAEEDAAMLITDYFMDEIVDQLIDSGEASTDINNDYDNGDGIFHEVITDRSYHMTEAAELLSQLYEYAEEDTGLWEGETNVDRLAEIQAAYTYGNAVWNEFSDLITEINDEVDDIKINAALDVLMENADKTEIPDYDELSEDETIEQAETKFGDEYEEKLRKQLIEKIKSFYD